MGNTRIDFLRGDVRIVGGDYGQIIIEGSTKAARIALDAISAATRLRGDQPRIDLCVDYDDSAQAFIPTRHAGLEGTSFRQVDIDELAGPKQDVEARTDAGNEGGNAQAIEDVQ
jgi:hypothetical protein